MNMEEFLQELYREELSDVFSANRANANIESRPKLFPLINSAMTYAYARWKIKYDSEMLDVRQDTKEYTLAATDLLSVIQLVNVYGLEVPTDEYQVLGNKIYFPNPQTQTLEVVYKVKHSKFTLEQDDQFTEIELPDLLFPWLRAYVCFRYFSGMKTESGQAAAAQFFSLAQLCENNFVNTNTTNEFTAPVNRKMESRGFA